MLTFQVVQPFSYAITGNTLNDAIKTFAKSYRNLQLTNLIIKDQTKYIDARFKYFFEDGKNRIGINTFPYVGPITIGPSFATYYDSILPGVSGIPVSPAMPRTGEFVAALPTLFSPTIPYTPVGVYTDPFIPTIVEINR